VRWAKEYCNSRAFFIGESQWWSRRAESKSNNELDGDRTLVFIAEPSADDQSALSSGPAERRAGLTFDP
jgi:hypothetical protein